jgi:hypothetical protein
MYFGRLAQTLKKLICISIDNSIEKIQRVHTSIVQWFGLNKSTLYYYIKLYPYQVITLSERFIVRKLDWI